MQNNKFKLKVITKNIDKINESLRDKLIAYNISQAGDCHRKEVVFAYYDAEELIAGLYAYQSYGMFYIDILWVDEAYRHKKLGAKLLKTAEEHAAKNSALYIRVNTSSFQAPEFYLKNGYKLFAKLPLLIEGNEQYFDYYFVKMLS